ncbi:MAG: T9SS type A sorting domain-containing protein [Flavobacteriales bacterium]|nr:T9SS type A sorting domain-containing protein [Flavobacteriales bacterium]
MKLNLHIILLYISLMLFAPISAYCQWDERFNSLSDDIIIPFATIYSTTAYQDLYFIGGEFKYYFSPSDSVESLVVYNKQTKSRVKLGQANEFNGIGTFLNGAWVTGSTVYSMLVDGDNLWVGGTFNRVGNTEAWGIARYNIVNKTWHSINSATYFPLEKVYSIQRYNNKLYLAGEFDIIGNDSVNHIITYDLNTQQFEPIINNGQTGANNTIQELLIADNKLFVSGNFTSIAGIAANKIAYLDLITNTWHPIIINGNNGFNGYTIYDMFYGNDTLYAVGNFTQAFGQPANNIAIIDLLNQTVSTPLLNFNHDVTAVTKHHSTLYLAGWFNFPRPSFVEYNLQNGQINNPWGIGPYLVGQPFTPVFSMEYHDNYLIIGGKFDKINGLDLQTINVATYHTQHKIWCNCYIGEALGLGGGYVDDVKPQALAFEKLNDDEIVVGGKFQWAGPCQKIKNIGILNKNTGTWRPLGTQDKNGIKHTQLSIEIEEVTDVEVYGDTIYVAGWFDQLADSISASSFARYIVTTNSWKGYSLPYNLVKVKAMARKGKYMYLVGQFAPSINEWNQTFTYLLKYDLESETLVTPEVNIYQTSAGALNNLYDIDISSNYLVTGGRLIDMAQDCSIFGYNYLNSQAHVFPDCNFSGEIFDVLLDGDNLYLAGGFFSLNGNNSYRLLAKYNLSLQQFTDLLPQNDNLFYGTIYSIDKKDHYLYVAGTIPYFGNLTDVRRVVAINLQTNEFIPFGTPLHNGIGSVYDASGGSRVRKVKVIDNDVWFGGEFNYVNKDNGDIILSAGIARWNGIYIGTESISDSSIPFRIFPNPASQVVNLHSSTIIKQGTPVEIQLFDMGGRLLFHRIYNNSSELITIPVSELNSGVYIIKVKTDNNFYSGKFIMQ